MLSTVVLKYLIHSLINNNISVHRYKKLWLGLIQSKPNLHFNFGNKAKKQYYNYLYKP